MPADSSTNCRRFSTTSNEPWRFGLISERSDPFEFVCRFVPSRSLYGRRPRPAPILRAKRRLQGPRPDPGPMRPFPSMPGLRRRRATRMRVPLKFRHAHAFANGEARQSARSSPPWRLSSRSKENTFLTRQWRFCAKYQVNASLGERSRSRFPDDGASGTAAVSEPPAFTTRNADGCQDSPRRCQSAAGKMPEARPTHGPPTLGEMCASFTGIKYTFHCAAIKCERSAIFFPRKTSETWYKHLFQNYRFAYFGAFVSHLY